MGVTRQSVRAATIATPELYALCMRLAIRVLTLLIFAAAAGAVIARAEAQPVGAASGLPLPRFVSLKTDKVVVRIGPNKNHEVKWLYQRAGLPVEITAEFENWRRIRDSDGTEGWVYHSLLSGRRTGVVTANKSKDDLIPVYEDADGKSGVAARLEPGVLGSVKRCNAGWCRINGQGFDGWIPQERLWGVYPNEKVE
jgi:SH3-like domain-containing protein